MNLKMVSIFFEGKKLEDLYNNTEIRNPGFNGTNDIRDKDRLTKLVVDAGPKSISNGQSANFDNKSDDSSYYNQSTQKIESVDYPKLFPSYPSTRVPEIEQIETLGSIETDAEGRLIVLAAYGKASGFDANGDYDPNVDLDNDVNNNNWFDDTGDGPVTAVLVLDNGTHVSIEGNAWVITTDPSYAPQIPNIVNLWDEIYNTWIEKFGLVPDLYDLTKWPNDPNAGSSFALGTGYNSDYKPHFDQQLDPMLKGTNLQRWIANLVDDAVTAHQVVGNSTASGTDMANLLSFIRNPNIEDNNQEAQNKNRMPLSLGDSGQDFLAMTRTQYFLMYQWLETNKDASSPEVFGPGEALDRNILGNCLGGRFSPGIEMTFIIRDEFLYNGWNNTTGSVPTEGPFRINMEPMDYSNITTSPFLGVGYVPTNAIKVEPGDICKFMSIPWHTDYNSCATHQPSPNAARSNLTYWSWPAQRPVAIYSYKDLACEGKLLERFSVRGEGTEADTQVHVGRYQDRKLILDNWQNIGTVLQGSLIDQKTINNLPSGVRPPNPATIKDYYLEVDSNFKEDDSNKVVKAPIDGNDSTTSPPSMCPHFNKPRQ